MSITKKPFPNTHKAQAVPAPWGTAGAREVLALEKAEYLGEYQLRLHFRDGHTQSVDFQPFLSASSHPDVRKYLDKEQFVQYAVQHGDLVWGDYEMLFPLADIYRGEVK